MKRRNLTPQQLAALQDTPVVYLQGPRQSGKTTLVQSLRVEGHPAEYFTLDDALDSRTQRYYGVVTPPVP